MYWFILGCGLTQERHRCTYYACAIPWPPSAHSRFKLHLISLMYMNLMTERADMPCIVACQFQSLIWVETRRQIFTKSQILLLTAMQKLPPVMQSINIHSPCCKDGGGNVVCVKAGTGRTWKIGCMLVGCWPWGTYVRDLDCPIETTQKLQIVSDYTYARFVQAVAGATPDKAIENVSEENESCAPC
jgi:hypothetical protein